MVIEHYCDWSSIFVNFNTINSSLVDLGRKEHFPDSLLKLCNNTHGTQKVAISQLTLPYVIRSWIVSKNTQVSFIVRQRRNLSGSDPLKLRILVLPVLSRTY